MNGQLDKAGFQVIKFCRAGIRFENTVELDFTQVNLVGYWLDWITGCQILKTRYSVENIKILLLRNCWTWILMCMEDKSV